MSKSVSIKLPCSLVFISVAKAVEAAAITSVPTLGKISRAAFSMVGAPRAESFGVGGFIVSDANGCGQTRLLLMGSAKLDGMTADSSSSIGFVGTMGVRLSS